MKTGLVKGCISVVTKQIRRLLKPIPNNHTTAMIEMLKSLCQMKVNKIQYLLQTFSVRMRKSPHLLHDFIHYCEIHDRFSKFTDDFRQEINFIDQLLDFFQDLDINFPFQNPFGVCFETFALDKETASTTRRIFLKGFIRELKDMIKAIDHQIDTLSDEAVSIPASLKDINIEERIRDTTEIREKIFKLAPEVAKMKHFQSVLGVILMNFCLFPN